VFTDERGVCVAWIEEVDVRAGDPDLRAPHSADAPEDLASHGDPRRA
jgi:hypothetical protein